LAYIAEQIRQHLGLTLAVWPVSVLGGSAALLDAWFEEQIAPLYERHQQLADESVRRKIAALRESVEAALRSKLDRVEGTRPSDAEALRQVEKELRRTAGRIPEETSACLRAADDVEKLAPVALREAASRIVERWRQGQNAEAGIVTAAVLETATGAADQLYVRLESLARELTAALQQAAQQLDVTEIPQEQELVLALREMPQLDFGGEPGSLKRSPFVSLAGPLVQARVESRLRRLLGREVSEAFRSYRRLLEAWVRRAIGGMQARFDSHADTYRAQLSRLLGSSEASPEAAEAIRSDLTDIRFEPAGVGGPAGGQNR
jgi:DNA-binding protein Fis